MWWGDLERENTRELSDYQSREDGKRLKSYSVGI